MVTGYQEIKKTRMTGSVEVVTSKDIANKGYTSIEDVLKGQMAGVAVMNLIRATRGSSYNPDSRYKFVDRRYGSYLDHRWNASFGRCSGN